LIVDNNLGALMFKTINGENQSYSIIPINSVLNYYLTIEKSEITIKYNSTDDKNNQTVVDLVLTFPLKPSNYKNEVKVSNKFWYSQYAYTALDTCINTYF